MNTLLSQALATSAAATAIVFTIALPVVAAQEAGASTRTVTNPNAKGRFAGQADKVYTPEEIRSARPLEWKPADSPDPRYQSGNMVREESPPTTDPVQSGKPGLPRKQADKEAQKAFSDQWRLLREMDEASKEDGAGSVGKKSSFAAGENAAADDTGFGTANIYSGYRGNFWLAQQQAFPWKVVGKLLIDGGGYCTAQSITGAPKNIIVTAAHCVHNRSSFYTGWTFVPAERNGAAPYGQYRWASARVLTNWITIGGRRYDVALIRLQNNAATGRPVSYYTGWLGWGMNFPYVQHLHSIGYASNISTQWTSMCAAESFFASCESTDVLVKGCNMTYGSSGGAWIDQYKPYEVSGRVQSVVSGPSCAGAFGQTYVGARFSSGNLGVLCSAEGGCTTP